MTGLKTLIWTVFVAGTATIWVPYLILTSRFNLVPAKLSTLRYVGVVPVLLGACFYLWCAWDFTFAGKGTPAPFDPPKKIVVGGLYRFVRNPIYIGVILMLVGEAILFDSIVLFVYPTILFLGFHLWTRYYEEPILKRKFGESYESYCRQVPRWIPGRRR